MENNYNNNNGQPSDSFYSYNQNNASDNGTAGNGSYEAGAYNGTIYGSYQNGSGYQNANTYQNNAYQSSMNYQETQQVPPQKKEKKKRAAGFGTKLAKCAALALVFGLVSGVTFEGIHIVSGQLFGQEDTGSSAGVASGSVLKTTPGDQQIEPTSTSSTYVATDVSDIVESSMPSIVSITNVSEKEYQSFWGGAPQKYENTSLGSGIIVSQDDKYLYVVTNNHVVDGATSLTVTFNDSTTVSAEVKGTDPSTDLAVVRVDLDSVEEGTMNNIKVATLGDSDSLKVGQASIAIGNALGYGQSVTTGCISALNREVSVSDSSSNTRYTAELIQTDAAINPGNSGGALLNAVGEVIGINSVKYSDTEVEGIGYAIPISKAIPIIQDLITKEKVDDSESAYLGIAGVDVTSDVAKTYNMPSGVYVAQVTAGSSAEEAGIQKGDIVTEFDGKTVASMEELASTLEYYKAGTTVDVKIMRASNGQYIENTISVTLGKKN